MVFVGVLLPLGQCGLRQAAGLVWFGKNKTKSLLSLPCYFPVNGLLYCPAASLGVGEDKHRLWTPMRDTAFKTRTHPPRLHCQSCACYSLSVVLLYRRQKPPTYTLTPTRVRPKLFTALWRAISHRLITFGGWKDSNSDSGGRWSFFSPLTSRNSLCGRIIMRKSLKPGSYINCFRLTQMLMNYAALNSLEHFLYLCKDHSDC